MEIVVVVDAFLLPRLVVFSWDAQFHNRFQIPRRNSSGKMVVAFFEKKIWGADSFGRSGRLFLIRSIHTF
jgi:hypothetical protein